MLYTWWWLLIFYFFYFVPLNCDWLAGARGELSESLLRGSGGIREWCSVCWEVHRETTTHWSTNSWWVHIFRWAFCVCACSGWQMKQRGMDNVSICLQVPRPCAHICLLWSISFSLVYFSHNSWVFWLIRRDLLVWNRAHSR